MSLKNISRIALAFGALTIASMPAFADTAPMPPTSGTPAVHAATGVQKVATVTPAKKTRHVKKLSAHHRAKGTTSTVQNTGLTAKKPSETKADPKL